MAKLRHIGLALALAATAAAAFLGDDKPGEIVAPARRAQVAHAPEASIVATTVTSPAPGLPEQMVRATYVTESPNLFPTRSWLPPPPVLPPEKPKAPPLPFRYLGQLEADDATIVFLADQQKNLVVHAGDMLNGTYQVDAVTAQGMTLTYLPLKEKQQLNFGSAK